MLGFEFCVRASLNTNLTHRLFTVFCNLTQRMSTVTCEGILIFHLLMNVFSRHDVYHRNILNVNSIFLYTFSIVCLPAVYLNTHE